MEKSKSLAGSFRDPDGFFFLFKGVIYRKINNLYKEDYDFYIRTKVRYIDPLFLENGKLKRLSEEDKNYKELMYCSGNEDTFVAKVICPCGNNNFELLYPGQTHMWKNESIPCVAEINGNYFLIIKVRCSECNEEHLIFDSDFL